MFSRERAKLVIRYSSGVKDPAKQDRSPARGNDFCPMANGGQWAELGPEPGPPCLISILGLLFLIDFPLCGTCPR